MIIGIDGNEANNDHRVGIGQYAYQLLRHIHQQDSQNKYSIYLKTAPLPDLPPASSHWHYRVFGPHKLWTRLALPLHLFIGPKPDLFISLGHYTPLFSPSPVICAIMDLGFLHYPEQFTPKDLYQLKNWTKNSIKHSTHIITISEFTKKEIADIYHIPLDKISVIYPGVELPAAIDTENPFPHHPYFLSLGTLKPSKNIPFLIQAFAQFHQTHRRYKLVITGKKGWLYDEIFATVSQLNLQDDIVFMDYITESFKWSLLKHAQALIIPSLYEGFGIPAIEAMAVGTPVLSSNAASLPEVIDRAGILFDPTNLTDLLTAMTSIIKPGIYQKYSRLGPQRSATFSWDKAALNFIKLLKAL
ncbi:glycosyltransferase family 4 protein [Patescibacteria group bacterium]|nr:glycosyltransferase family 4 protein [Patescibacteria group bacterium]